MPLLFTPTERRAVIGLSLVMSLRMIGLFMVLPMFAVHAMKLSGATALLMGVAMGVYGLCQALFQIPFGILSDYMGRKPVIGMGLIIFIIGSVIAGEAHSITTMIIGRSLQGVGAIGGTILAMLSDLTRDNVRTVSMAIAGVTIGISFAVALLLGPILAKWYTFDSLFFLAAIFGAVGILVLYSYVPTPTVLPLTVNPSDALRSFCQLFSYPQLNLLNSGIFVLHAVFIASFIAIPLHLLQVFHLETWHQWSLYVPTLGIAFILVLVSIQLAERQHTIRRYFLGSILLLAISEIWLWLFSDQLFSTAAALCLFFACFSLLEALLPSLVSRLAPAECKGGAMGLYSCSQFLGIFAGGMAGGWLFGQFSFTGIYIFCIIMLVFWLIFASFIQIPSHFSNNGAH